MPQPAKYQNNAARQAAYRARCQEAQKQQAKQRGLPSLPSLPTLPGTARWRAALSLAHSLVEEICTQMQDYSDERSEAWQESERAQEMLTRLETLEEVRDQMQTLL
jgi:hypothetical protein